MRTYLANQKKEKVEYLKLTLAKDEFYIPTEMWIHIALSIIGKPCLVELIYVLGNACLTDVWKILIC